MCVFEQEYQPSEPVELVSPPVSLLLHVSASLTVIPTDTTAAAQDGNQSTSSITTTIASILEQGETL